MSEGIYSGFHCEEAVFADEAISNSQGGDCFAENARNDNGG